MHTDRCFGIVDLSFAFIQIGVRGQFVSKTVFSTESCEIFYCNSNAACSPTVLCLSAGSCVEWRGGVRAGEGEWPFFFKVRGGVSGCLGGTCLAYVCGLHLRSRTGRGKP